MLPNEAAVTVFECSEGFEEVDKDLIEEIQLDEDNSSELKVLVVIPDDVNGGQVKQLLTIEVPSSSNEIQQIGEWAVNHYAAGKPNHNVRVTSVGMPTYNFKYLIEISPRKMLENQLWKECNSTQSTSYGVPFDDVIEEVIEEVLDVEEEENSRGFFEEVEVLSNVDTERDENNIEEKNIGGDVSIENLRECNENVDIQSYNLSGLNLTISDTDDYNDNDTENPSQMEIEIEDSPVSNPKSTKHKSNNGVEILMIYPSPPTKGGISVNTEDYKCLGEDTYLNDVIIDFYLKYVWLEMLSPVDRERTHIFSSHFFTRLARSYTIHDCIEDMTEAEKGHSGVQRWTKNVNIFEKDFIVLPVNEHSHWFLVIICFANLVGAVGSRQSDCFINGEEAQSPCILIFDSLGNKDKYHVVDTLRSYLSVEYRTKTGKEKHFTKDTLKTVYVKVPQQMNATDCGLYVLQYAESFFKNPIQDFTLPFKDLSNWFEHCLIVEKRKQIAELITDLAIDFSEDKSVNLPEVKFPKYFEVNSSDNKDDSWSLGYTLVSLDYPKTKLTLSQPSENSYEFVTTQKPLKYQLKRSLVDTKPTYYKRNSTLINIKKSFSHLKGIFDDSSDDDCKPIESTSDLEIFDENTKSPNNSSSTSDSCFVDVESESTMSKQRVRKPVPRATEIQEQARNFKGRKRNEDSRFHKKNYAKTVSLINSHTSTKFPGKGRILGSSPWMSKYNGSSSNFPFALGISSERFYGCPVTNETTVPSNLKFKKLKKTGEHGDST